VLLAIAGLCVLLPTDGVGASPADCATSAAPQLAPSLANLRQALGELMGSPVSCPKVNSNGEVVQLTTTGLAASRADGTAVFASGERHWALTGASLETWTGNWHNGLYPTPASSSTPDQSVVAPQPLALIEPMRVVQVAADGSDTLVLQNPAGAMFSVETVGGCPGVVSTVGDDVFVRSSGPRRDVILLPQNETCAVAEMNTTASD
jgi:hypothetical protein